MSSHLIHELNYQKDMRLFYQNLSHLPGFVLLESSDTSRGRYDILSACPYRRLIIKENTVDKRRVFNRIKKMLPIKHSHSSLPFQGGAIGYIAYDLGERLFNIQSEPQNTLADMPLLDLGLYDWAIIVDHQLKKTTLFAANRHKSTAKHIPKVMKLWEKKATDKEFIVKHEFKPLITKKEYQNAFEAVYNALKAGRSYQVNLTQPFQAAYEGDSWQIYKQVSSKNKVPFSAFLKSSDGDILSFSPERFLSFGQGHLLTSPIKGTLHRSSEPVEDDKLREKLAHSAKNSAENVMIVDLLRNDLGKIAKPGTVHVSKLLEVQSFKEVHHLVSTIEAEGIDTLHPFDLFLSCFPGGSITGAPKLEAMRIISELERYSRGIYCGSIGYFSQHGQFDTNIAIRTIVARSNVLHLSAGGGIVIDSDWEDEYRECFTKIAAIIHGLK